MPSEAGDAAAPLTETDVRFRYLAARCLAAVGDWDAVLGLLATPSGDKDLEEVSPMVLWIPALHSLLVGLMIALRVHRAVCFLGDLWCRPLHGHSRQESEVLPVRKRRSAAYAM